ncbi:ABC transporter ATP-binding protein/permease [Porticoccaceae bacterium]|jgi:ATP-binding cassette subfamily B protein/ATP-binding cassette subfamily B multidrug efflux pump|nr:ABC transporter ATP-binding protein/permease [Porticoccaceae bacterium]MDA8878483.1 ABC transporter ATP-binding protein/permease [Porticoccaceae bacterium]MDB2558146.1 ABC transporter ATP-binding protein/permease [Porticoccaceae bacterium]
MFGFFERLVDPFPKKAAQRPPDSVYQFCRHYSRGMEPWLLLMAFLTAITAISEALLFGILGQVVDWLSESNPETFIEQSGSTLIGMGIFMLILIPLSNAMRSLIVHQTLMGNFPMSVRWMAHRYLLNQSYGFFQNEFSGRIATKVMQTALAVRDTVMKLLDVMLFVAIYMVTALILVASADPRLCIPLIIWLFFYIIVQRYFVPKMKKIAMVQADARSLMTGRIVDSYTNIITLKLFSHSNRESAYIRDGMSEFLNTVHPQMRLVTKLNICLWALNMSLVFSTAALGIYLWFNGSITPGAIAIVMSLAIRLTSMSHWILWEISGLFENIGTVQDGINTLSVPSKVNDKPNAIALNVNRGDIIFDSVNFSYNTSEAVFENLDLQIPAGEKVGIVGRSGAGKSSLVSLLLRFYDIQSGAITIDGHNIEGVRQESLRSNIAMVTQDTSLLHRSVRENIMFGRPEATEEEMVVAAKKAQAHDFILSLRDNVGRGGYDAHVGERGVTLSGGQRQRIAIARVLLKDAPILVLDEATSALDSEVEAAIQLSLYQLMEGKTVIAIAHRLSTIAAMDRLIVFDEGKIIEQGTHQELLRKNGIYTKLWGHQSGGFLGFE